MTKNIIALALVIISLVSCKNKDNDGKNLHLTGNIKGLSQGKLYIQQVQDSTLKILDSIIIKGDSKFDTYLNIESPEMLYLFLDRGQTNSIDNNLPFFAEPGEMKIETTLNSFFADAKITGSKNQVLYDEFKQMMAKFNDKNMGLVEKELENYKSKNKNSMDSISTEANKLTRKKYLYIANFATVHADKEIAPFLALSEIADINVRYLDSIDAKMNPEVAKSKYGKMLKSYIKERKVIEKK
ncbi:DUF4369 domain-containing protein [uncultured Flavobacterium sp.]|uniref:DUF4369 domain-containing protein n=1 Tax=uncultured Flavobacterium sp. TaxID=165435 RepID=UPI0030EDC20D|tara:strand:+ start:277392 stop:278114 length:723 start_codon:yes stop_codon:yes gene_type:complete